MDTSLAPSEIGVPPGHIFVNKKWIGSELGSIFSKESNFTFTNGMGFIDFYASDSCPVVYVTESDILLKETYVLKIKELAEVYRRRGVVITRRDENFSEVQDLASVQLKMTTLPIANQKEIPRILTQMAYAEGRPNPFSAAGNPKNTDSLSVQISVLASIPGVGETGARKLLSEYGHIRGVSCAPITGLKRIIGASTAKEIINFFKDESTK